MKRPGSIFPIILVVFLSACGASQSQVLEQNRSLWESQAIQHYRFDLDISGNFPWYAMMPMTVEVQNGAIVSMVASNGGDITPYLDTFLQNGTVENLFDTIDSALSGWVYRHEVQYDATYGFPVSIVIERSRFMTDDATGYYVAGFEILP